MAFIWKEDSSYNSKLELDDDFDDDDDDKLTNKTLSKRSMLQLAGAATASNWGSNVFQLMLFKTKDSSQFHVRNNEFQTPDPLYSSFTPCSQITNPTKTIGNKAIKASLDLKDGEYVLKLTTVKTNSTTAAEQAQTAAMLLSQAALLRKLGEKLLLQSEFFKSLDI